MATTNTTSSGIAMEHLPKRLLLIFAVFTAGIAIAGLLLFLNEREQIRSSSAAVLTSIRDLKIDRIVHWRQERLSDATFIRDNPIIADRIRLFLAEPDNPLLRRQLRQWMEAMMNNFDYEAVFIVDTRFQSKLSTGTPDERIPDTTVELMRKAAAGEVQFGPFFEDRYAGDIDIDIAVPLPADSVTGSNVAGFVVLRVDPSRFLFPFIQQWPTPSASTETLLVGREGDQAVFLNILRHSTNLPLRYRFPVSRKSLPAVMAVSGVTGVVEGKDYREEPVFASLGPIPDTPWFIVAKIDTAEVFAPLRRRTGFIAAAILSLIFSAGMGTLVWWRQQREDHFRRLYETETKHRHLEERFAMLSRHANDIILLIDSGGRIVEANERAATAYGYSREELLSLTIGDLRAPEAVPLLGDQMRQVGQRNGLVFETMHRRRSGAVFPVEVSSRMLETAEGSFFQSIVRDITERKEAEQKLIHANRLYAVLSHTNQTIVKTPDRDRLFSEACRIAVEHGRFRMAWIGVIEEETGRVRPAVHYGDEQGYLDGIRITVHDEEQGRGPIGTALREDRPVISNDIASDSRFSPWRDAALSRGFRSACALPLRTGERVTGALTLYSDEKNFFDEVELRLLEEVAADISFGLSQIEREQDRRLLEQQLRQFQKMEAVGQLAGGIAHDFNNILSAIMGYANLLEMKLERNDALRTNVAQILASSERAARLTRSLLAFSRQQIINPQPVDVSSVIRSIEGMLARIIGEDIDLRTELSVQPLVVMADSGQIEQVLMNLCTNARDAMPDGGLLLIETGPAEMDERYVATHGYGASGGYALISVTDSGLGMDAKTRERIFEPFFSTKPAGRGTGLGLSMAYGIVRQHKGFITVYSEIGKGTTFKIYLPLTDEAVAAETAASDQKTALPRGTETILIAEDDEMLRRLMRSVIEEFGYTVIEAEDGAEALGRFRERASDIDLLILDVVMPKKNGKEVFDEIQQARPGAKALFLSGYTANVIHKKGILDRGLDFLMKPVPPRELLMKIRAILDRAA